MGILIEMLKCEFKLILNSYKQLEHGNGKFRMAKEKN